MFTSSLKNSNLIHPQTDEIRKDKSRRSMQKMEMIFNRYPPLVYPFFCYNMQRLVPVWTRGQKGHQSNIRSSRSVFQPLNKNPRNQKEGWIVNEQGISKTENIQKKSTNEINSSLVKIQGQHMLDLLLSGLLQEFGPLVGLGYRGAADVLVDVEDEFQSVS